jgi:large subunit ribosomal protein L21
LTLFQIYGKTNQEKKNMTENKETKKVTKPVSVKAKEKQLAVFAFGGHQFSSYVGSTVQAENTNLEKGKTTEVIDLLTGKKITLRVSEVSKGPKIGLIKFKNKTRYLKRMGHRQTYAHLLIESVV